MASKQYDFIIIGGGTAGCILANRLSADAANRVLVLEAGLPDYALDFRLQMPAALTMPLASRTYNWWYETEPEPHLNNRRVYQPRGKVLGGSSTINGTAYVRGNAMDFEKWAAEKGLENWDYTHCLPYFKKAETRLIGGDDYRGSDGPMYTTTGPAQNPLYTAWLSAVQQAGHPMTEDVNGYKQEGFGLFERCTYKGRRHTSARAYWHPIKQRSNVTLTCRAFVLRVLFENQTAVGVEFAAGKSTQKAFAKEIICCGGAFNTPQLLQLCGIGNAQELEKLGIQLVQDLPGVGENLQDHLEVYIQHACTKPVSLYSAVRPFNKAIVGLKWLLFKTGEGASNHVEAGGFIRSNDNVAYPNLEYHFFPIAINYAGATPVAGHGFQAHVGPMNSDSRGFVKIVSTDPRQYPRILFNYLSTEKDRREFLEGIRCTRHIFSQPAFDEYRGPELAPGSDAREDEDLLEFIRNHSESGYHASCTCKMGYDEMAVVDTDLKVHGIENLRIVDASVMPYVTNGNIMAPVIMIAEKAADQILGNTPLPQSKAPFYRHRTD